MKNIYMRIISIIILVFTLNSCVFLQDFYKREKNIAASNKEKFKVDLASPKVDVTEIEAQFNRPFPLSGVAKHDIKVTYFPLEDAVCLEYRSNGYTYHQFWHKTGRNSFVEALEKYKADYSAQKLRNKNTKTKTQYGVIKGSYLHWQSFSLTPAATGNMEMALGYYFKDGSPFFSITQLEAFFESPTLNKELNRTSPEIPIFFTRAQADELSAIFDQDFLVSIIPENYLQAIQQGQRREESPADFDDY
jgi:hypothetical protein